jgi:hypothetical protein
VIKWPKTWDTREGWGSAAESPRTQEARLWVSLARALGVTIEGRVAALGGPVAAIRGRTLEQLKEAVRTYWGQHKKRPSANNSRDWKNANGWLRARGSTLQRLCDDLKIPAKGLTMPLVTEEVRSYWRTHKKRPTNSVSPLWASREAWLYRRGSSLYKLCNELALPGGILRRTLPQVKADIRLHYKKTGKRPTQKASVEWKKTDAWLRQTGSSLPQVCAELGLPDLVNLDRSLSQVKKDIRLYYKKTGRRPTQRTSVAWRRYQAWLYNRGSSLAQVCAQLGLPSGKRSYQR